MYSDYTHIMLPRQHTHTQPCTHTPMHTHTHTYTHVRVHTHTYTHTHQDPKLCSALSSKPGPQEAVFSVPVTFPDQEKPGQCHTVRRPEKEEFPLDRVGQKQLCREGGTYLAAKEGCNLGERQVWTPNTACHGD